MVAEYNQRARLKDLGITQSLNDLDAFRAEGFLVISEEIAVLTEKEHERRAARSNRRG